MDVPAERTRFFGLRHEEKFASEELDLQEGGKYNLVNWMQPLGMKFTKVLGKGGQGLAVLFQRQEMDGSTRSMVVKTSTNETDVQLETANMRVSLTAPIQGKLVRRGWTCTPDEALTSESA